MASAAFATDGGSTAGKLLVAQPDIGDPRFSETVIYICRHDGEGAFGLVLNRRLGEMALARVLESFGVDASNDQLVEDARSIEVRQGGPVEGRRGYVMHSDDFDPRVAACHAHGFRVSTSLDVIEALAAGHGPKRAILFLGYAGWGPGQLENELARKDWIVVPADRESLLDGDLDGMWRRAYDRRGMDL